MSGRIELPAGLELVVLERAAGARDEAVRRARDGAEEGTLVWVHHVDDPRARAGRAWIVGQAPGLHAALVLRPGLPARDCAQLGPVAAIALGRALSTVVEPMTELHYRWPNDVLLDGGKVAGVWLDGEGDADCIDWLVVSWAVNTEATPESLGFDAAALQSDGAAGAVDHAALLQAVARELVSAIGTWDEAGFEPLLKSWRGRLALGGAIHLDLGDGNHVAGIAEALDEDGGLSVRANASAHRVTLERFFGLPEASP
ncbi:MAG: biotin/lipoate--protein ligase family protein [Halofilum sp. (in: g-proteobacteria)]|nr:biotin/lipoate--protein ligase family protein [Halofilum sp. (in: g-proteobacteria)]